MLASLQQTLIELISKPLPATGVSLLVLVGLATLASKVWSLLEFLNVYFLRPGKNLRRLGDWAAVTGATDGIGKAYAEALAKRGAIGDPTGFNVILVSRTEAKLTAVATDIEARYGVQTKVVPADFAAMDDATWEALDAVLGSVPLGVLVNSAGVSYDHAEYFDQVDDAQVMKLIAVNIVAITKMCSIAVRSMKARKRGAIVNIGSASATYLPSYPLYAVYAATKDELWRRFNSRLRKAFVDELTKDLAVELAPFGVTVENQAPFYVATKMSKIRRPRLDAPSPKAWVAAGIRQIGHNSQATPYWFHAIMVAVMSVVPVSMLNGYLVREHQKFRSLWYKKQERLQKKGT